MVPVPVAVSVSVLLLMLLMLQRLLLLLLLLLELLLSLLLLVVLLELLLERLVVVLRLERLRWLLVLMVRQMLLLLVLLAVIGRRWCFPLIILNLIHVGTGVSGHVREMLLQLLLKRLMRAELGVHQRRRRWLSDLVRRLRMTQPGHNTSRALSASRSAGARCTTTT